MGFWNNFGHFIYKSEIVSLDLLDLSQILHDNPNLRLMGTIKMVFGAHKTFKSNQKMGLWDSFEHINYKKWPLYIQSVKVKTGVIWETQFEGPLKMGIGAHKDHNNTQNYDFGESFGHFKYKWLFTLDLFDLSYFYIINIIWTSWDP